MWKVEKQMAEYFRQEYNVLSGTAVQRRSGSFLDAYFLFTNPSFIVKLKKLR
ncbi:MAG: hypothetical protein NC300_09310 [Bacteroidales bacterium]|nr:hypothetical protein [Clostridium sp.]MCM1204328.1 hypothetical protein [Bacteroidales bacterium]